MKRLGVKVTIVVILVISSVLGISCSNPMVPSGEALSDASAMETRAPGAGFRVVGSKLLDANGNTFVMRGVNHAHAWYPDKLDTALSGIASQGANTVRIVLSNGVRWTRTSATDVANIITKAKAKNLVTILEVHDTTGYNEQGGASTLSQAVSYWIDIKSALIGQEDYVLINIGNEPFGNNQSSGNQWVEEHKTAITALRQAGLRHALVVDAPNWGQDWQNFMRDRSSELLAHDANLVFSVHMYEVYQDFAKIDGYVAAFTNNNKCLIIGEFGADHKGMNVDEASIMTVAKNRQVGYLGWSWSGNGSEFASLDIVSNWNSGSLTTWGNTLIHGSNGIKATSVIASIFGGTSPTPPPPVATKTLFTFDETTSSWIGTGVSGGPWSVGEWKIQGTASLKADVAQTANKIVQLSRSGTINASGYTKAQVTVRHATWGTMGTGMKARFYIKTGPTWAWKDSGWVSIGSSTGGTVLTISLTGIANLGDVREVGIEYQSASNASGNTAVYADWVRLQ